MDASQWFIQFLNGISYGMLLFLLAAGLSLIFGVMGILNLAHGSFYMLGAYIGVSIMLQSNSFVLALLGGGLAVALIGCVIERLFFRPLHGQELNQILLTFGIILVIKDIAKGIWGGIPHSISEPIALQGSVSIFGNSFPTYRIALIGMGGAIAVLLWYLVEKTRLGSIIRAGVDDREMVMGMGINISWVFIGVVALGSFLSALGGVLGGPIFGASPGLDLEILILALVVVVVGGMGTLKGALLGSLLIGIIDNFGKVFFPNLSIFTIYAAMVVILIVKPKGLLGRERP